MESSRINLFCVHPLFTAGHKVKIQRKERKLRNQLNVVMWLGEYGISSCKCLIIYYQGSCVRAVLKLHPTDICQKIEYQRTTKQERTGIHDQISKMQR